MTTVRVERMHPTLVAVVRGGAGQRELPRVIPAACGEVWSYARSAGLKSPGRHVAIYLNRRTSYECGVEVGEPFEGTTGWCARGHAVGIGGHGDPHGILRRAARRHETITAWWLRCSSSQ